MFHLHAPPCRKSSAGSADLLLAPLPLMFNVLQLHVLRNIMGEQNKDTGVGGRKRRERGKGKKKRKWGQTHTGDK